MSEKTAKRKPRTSVSTAAKVAAVERLKNGEKTQTDLAKELNVSQAAISQWLKGEAALRAAVDAGRGSLRTLHKPEYPLVERALVEFLELLEQADVSAPKTTTWSLLQARAQKKAEALVKAGRAEYKDFKASKGWLSDVMTRAGIKRIQLHGSGGDVDPETSKQAMEKFRQQLADLKVTSLTAIFNADETALFYK